MVNSVRSSLLIGFSCQYDIQSFRVKALNSVTPPTSSTLLLVLLVQLMTNHRFGGFILAAIAVNSVLIALEDYKDPGRLNGNPNIRNQIVSLSTCDTSYQYLLSYSVSVIEACGC